MWSYWNASLGRTNRECRRPETGLVSPGTVDASSTPLVESRMEIAEQVLEVAQKTLVAQAVPTAMIVGNNAIKQASLSRRDLPLSQVQHSDGPQVCR